MQLLVDVGHDFLDPGRVCPARVHGHELALAGVGLGELLDHAHEHPLVAGVLDAAREPLEHEYVVVLEGHVVHAGRGDVNESGFLVQEGQQLLGQVVDTEHIDCVVDFDAVLVEQVLLDDITRIVHQDVDPVHFGLDLLHYGGQVVAGPQLADDQVHILVAGAGDNFLPGGLGLLLVPADHVHLGALGSSKAGGLVANSTGCARDQVVDILQGALQGRVNLVLLCVHVVEVELHVELC